MLNIAIVDDEKTALMITKGAVEAFFSEKAVPFAMNFYTSPLTFLATLEEQKIDLAFLDIDMSELSGIETAKRLKEICPQATIIFLSQREDLVFDCLSVHPFGFVRKNKLFDDFAKVMDLFFETVYHQMSNDSTIQIQTKRTVTSIEANSLMYVEGSGNYQDLKLKDGNVIKTRTSMKELEESLSPFGFIRIHKGFLVNCSYIRRISKQEVLLLDGTALPISRKNKEEVFQQYLKVTRKQDAFLIN